MIDRSGAASAGMPFHRQNSVADLALTLRAGLLQADVEACADLSDPTDIRALIVHAFEALGELSLDREHRSDLGPFDDMPAYSSSDEWLMREVDIITAGEQAFFQRQATLDDRMYALAELTDSVYREAAREAPLIGAGSLAHAQLFLAAIARHGPAFKPYFSLVTFDQQTLAGKTVRRHHAVLFDNLARYGGEASPAGRQQTLRTLPDFYGYLQRRAEDVAMIDPGGAIKFSSFRTASHRGETQDRVTAMLDSTQLSRDLPTIVSFLGPASRRA